MPARRKSESAARQFIAALGSATSCVTARRLEISRSAFVPDAAITALFPDPVPLRSPAGGPSGLFFDVSVVFTIAAIERDALPPRWAGKTEMYQYRLLDRGQRELLVYHWQPGPDYAGPDEPHLHVSAALSARIDAVTSRPIDLDTLHLATGLVSLAMVVRMLITEFKIAPLRPDWRQTLDRLGSTLGFA